MCLVFTVNSDLQAFGIHETRVNRGTLGQERAQIKFIVIPTYLEMVSLREPSSAVLSPFLLDPYLFQAQLLHQPVLHLPDLLVRRQ